MFEQENEEEFEEVGAIKVWDGLFIGDDFASSVISIFPKQKIQRITNF